MKRYVISLSKLEAEDCVEGHVLGAMNFNAICSSVLDDCCNEIALRWISKIAVLY